LAKVIFPSSTLIVLKTLLGKVFPQTLPHVLGLGSRLSHSMVKQGGLILCSYICDDVRSFGEWLCLFESIRVQCMPIQTVASKLSVKVEASRLFYLLGQLLFC